MNNHRRTAVLPPAHRAIAITAARHVAGYFAALVLTMTGLVYLPPLIGPIATWACLGLVAAFAAGAWAVISAPAPDDEAAPEPIDASAAAVAATVADLDAAVAGLVHVGIAEPTARDMVRARLTSSYQPQSSGVSFLIPGRGRHTAENPEPAPDHDDAPVAAGQYL